MHGKRRDMLKKAAAPVLACGDRTGCDQLVQLLHSALAGRRVATDQYLAERNGLVRRPVDTLQQDSELLQVHLLALLRRLQTAHAQLLELLLCQSRCAHPH